MNKFNERAWAGQLIAWIKESIAKGTTIFEHASNDEGIKVASGKTKFPDILLFTNKISGIIFNGWELKFPDTSVDDLEMLKNALEKAERLKSNSFVTWNGSEAVIWQIKDEIYKLENLVKLKIYPKDVLIANRNELADPTNYRKHEPKLKERLFEILHDLEQLFKNGIIKEAINISDNITFAIRDISQFVIPQFKEQIIQLKGDDSDFRKEFNLWKIKESTTLNLLSKSSRRVEDVIPEDVLAKFIYYKFIGKIIFYYTLAENLSGRVSKITLASPNSVKIQLEYFFVQAKKIDYQAVFEADFTDQINFTPVIDDSVFRLTEILNQFDFKILPSSVIGNILENLIPQVEKQKFGQYFTPDILANFVAFSVIKNRNFVLLDPTSGTGTFLNAFYQILNYLGEVNHQKLLNNIWGNDISHFPAILSVINLYKQKVEDTANFPRVIRKDFFDLKPEQIIYFPDNIEIDKINSVVIPQFDAIVSNFPFIQQEDIQKEQKEELAIHFKNEFDEDQAAFLKKGVFKINERSDYSIYCFYNSLKFLKPNGFLAAITSNAWLGKDYGIQFKKFLLDNFSILYIIRTNAEHWFKNAQVSTIFFVLQKGKSINKTRFVTLDFKLEEKFNTKTYLSEIEDFYTSIDNCENPLLKNWKQDEQFNSVFFDLNNKVRVSLVSERTLLQSLENHTNWAQYFLAENPLSVFDGNLIRTKGGIFDTGRGTRTGKDKMFILNRKDITDNKIEQDFLYPVLQNSRDLKKIKQDDKLNSYFFICNKPFDELENNFPNAAKWIKKWENSINKTGIKFPEVFQCKKPFWYTLQIEKPATIFISINPDKKLFFSYSETPIFLNQRLVCIRVQNENSILIAALLNSVVSLLILELNGVSRNLGVLDLNADFFKTKMKILNPALLDASSRVTILKYFESISNREISQFDVEFKKKDRIEFDEVILIAFGYSKELLPKLYELLISTIENRVNLKNK